MKHKSNLPPTKVKIIILSIAIAIVLSSFVILLVKSINPSPEWSDYCGKERAPKLFREQETITQVTCEANEGEWFPQVIQCVTEPCPQGYCDYYSECQKEYDTARDEHNLVLFIVSAIAGLLAITVGIILALPSVSSGLMIGGTFLMFFGTMSYWSNIVNWLRTIILGVVLVVLIVLGYKKLQG